MRARKIKVQFRSKEEEAEPELSTETGEVSGAPAQNTPTQLIAIDGEDLSYYGSITWECYPGNIEVIVNPQKYFMDSTFFYRAITEASREDKIVEQIVDKIWLDFDKDNSGYLDRDETRVFLETALRDVPGGEEYDDSKFDETYDAIDANGDGLMERDEMAYFIKALLRQAQ